MLRSEIAGSKHKYICILTDIAKLPSVGAL